MPPPKKKMFDDSSVPCTSLYYFKTGWRHIPAIRLFAGADGSVKSDLISLDGVPRSAQNIQQTHCLLWITVA